MDVSDKLSTSLDAIIGSSADPPAAAPSARGGKAASSRRGGGGGPSPYARGGGEGRGAASPPGVRVFVGNLGYRVSWQTLKDHCGSKGQSVLHANILTFPDGRSKGAGIVEFASPEDASQAIEQLRDTELEGRKVFLRADRETKGFGQADFRGGGAAPGAMPARPMRGPRLDPSAVEPGSKIFVQNLPWSMSWMDLKNTFARFGEVLRADVVLDAMGRSRGTGTVTFASAAMANEAIQGMNGVEVEGRVLTVRLDQRQNCALHVGNLPFSATWADIKTLFGRFGEVIRADVITDPATRRSKGFGTVIFASADAAAAAIKGLNETDFRGRNIMVKYDAYA